MNVNALRCDALSLLRETRRRMRVQGHRASCFRVEYWISRAGSINSVPCSKTSSNVLRTRKILLTHIRAQVQFDDRGAEMNMSQTRQVEARSDLS